LCQYEIQFEEGVVTAMGEWETETEHERNRKWIIFAKIIIKMDSLFIFHSLFPLEKRANNLVTNGMGNLKQIKNRENPEINFPMMQFDKADNSI
jgi:hypothetical protein